MARGQNWAAIVDRLRAPLGFFGLYLLALTTALGLALGLTELTPAGDLLIVLGYGILVTLAALGVASMAILAPESLADVAELKEKTEELEDFVDSDFFDDAVRQVVVEAVQAGALKPTVRQSYEVEEEPND